MSFGRNIILSCISRELYWPFHQRTWEFWKNSGGWWPLCHLCLYEWDCNPNQLRVTCSDGWLQPHLFLAGPPLGFTIRGAERDRMIFSHIFKVAVSMGMRAFSSIVSTEVTARQLSRLHQMSLQELMQKKSHMDLHLPTCSNPSCRV